MCIMWVLSLLKQTKKDTNSESVMCELTKLKKKKKRDTSKRLNSQLIKNLLSRAAS